MSSRYAVRKSSTWHTLGSNQALPGSSGTSSPISTAVTLLSGTLSGNTLVMAVSCDAAISAPPPGWTLHSNSSNLTYFGQYVYTRFAGAGESSWTITPDFAAGLAWTVLEVSAAASSAFDIAAAQSTQTTGNSYTSSSLTPAALRR
jgi:hypothetical protein